MIFKVLFVSIFLFSFTGHHEHAEFMQWTAARKLNWNDFKAEPPEKASHAALTSSGIMFSFSTNGKSFRYELACNFDRNGSWGRVKNDHILSHEQGHFDITEIYTRKLNKALQNYRFRSASFNKDIKTIYQDTMMELEQMQSQYDRQTDHSINELQQKDWLTRITTSLDNLEDYSNYH